MHTCGLVLNLCADPALALTTLDHLAAAGPFIINPSSGASRAVVLETSDPHSSQYWHDWAVALPGVANLEVVFVHWDEAETGVAHECS